MNRLMELDIWKGDWGLVSVDFDSLRLVTLCKFAGAQIQINLKRPTIFTPNLRLPSLKHFKHVHRTFEDVTNYLNQKNLCADYGLDLKQKADVVAFTTYLKEFLYPAILYVWWLDERNRISVSRKWYAKTLPFPLCLFYPDSYHKAAEQTVEGLFPHIESKEMLETEIYERAVQCLTVISQRLGTQEFLFGDHPTSIDATLFAYLAPIVKVPFPNSKLKNHLLSFNNLLKYVTRISQRYYPAENQVYETQRRQEQANTSSTIDNYPLRNQVFAAAFAIIGIVVYSITSGILQVDASSLHSSKTLLLDEEDED